MITDAIILVTGGTGTFGSAFVRYCLNLPIKEIRIFSRDEKKQYEMAQLYKNTDKVKFYIGDVRDKHSIDNAMKNVDYVFHAAAMKQVPTCEQYPIEAYKTNVLGSVNVLESAIEHKVKKIVCLSTDKAVYPTSTMGLTKSLMEKIALQKSKEQSTTQICITRFCNLIISNGSVVPLFIKQIDNNLPITITDPTMTRFFMSITEAIELVYEAFQNGNNGDIIIKYAKPCNIHNLAQGVCQFKNVYTHPVCIVGSRPGEKKHEMLITHEEFSHAILNNDYIVVNSSFLNTDTFDYSSDSLKQMSIEDIKTMIKQDFQ